MFEENFQLGLLKLIATNLKLANQYTELIKAEYFSQKIYGTIFEIIKRYVFRYEREITLSNLLTEIKEFVAVKGLGDDYEDIILDEAKNIFSTKVNSEEFIIDNLLSFARKKAMQIALEESVDILRDGGDYNQILKNIDEAVSVGAATDSGHNFDDLMNISAIYNNQYTPESLVRTGFGSMDRAIGGGMAPGEITCFLGGAKSGKSNLLCNIGAFNTALGKNVFHITLEIQSIEVLAKYAARLSTLTLDEVISGKNPNYHRKMRKFKKTSPNLHVKYFDEGVATTMDIRSWICKIRAEKGVEPDLLIIDYDECLRPTIESRDEYRDAGQVYLDLKALANYFQVPIATAAQTSRNAWIKVEQNELITSHDLAHSAKKAFRVSTLVTLNFKKNVNDGILYLDLVRRGRGSIEIPMKRDFSRALFREGPPDIEEDE